MQKMRSVTLEMENRQTRSYWRELLRAHIVEWNKGKRLARVGALGRGKL